MQIVIDRDRQILYTRSRAGVIMVCDYLLLHAFIPDIHAQNRAGIANKLGDCCRFLTWEHQVLVL